MNGYYKISKTLLHVIKGNPNIEIKPTPTKDEKREFYFWKYINNGTGIQKQGSGDKAT